MQPFTLDQGIVAGLLFLLGLLIGMFLMAGRKWKRRYADEAARANALEAENVRLAAQVRDHEAVRHQAERVPVQTVATQTVREDVRVVDTPAEPYRRVTPVTNADPDIVIRRP